jgi:xanthine dehydrogenase accessory factor
MAGRRVPPLASITTLRLCALTHDPRSTIPALLHAATRLWHRRALQERPRPRIERLKAQGVATRAAPHPCPIGLAIGAVSPPEIAISILGQIRAAAPPPERQ